MLSSVKLIILIGPGVRQPRWRCNAITNFQSLFLAKAACVRHTWWRTKQSWPLFSPTFFSFFFLVYFCMKKVNFRVFFMHGQRSVAEPRPTPSPWKITLSVTSLSSRAQCATSPPPHLVLRCHFSSQYQI